MKKIDVDQTISILANIGVIVGIVFLGVRFWASLEGQSDDAPLDALCW